MSYKIDGRLLEACSCKAICPCWVGEDPDGGRCSGTIAWRIDEGMIDGIDVSGLTVGILADIPGNVLQGNWRAALFIDDRATAEQESALIAVFSGQRGGPLADIAQLVGEVVSVERARIEADVDHGAGTLRIGNVMSAEMQPLKGGSGEPTRLYDAVFSFRPGAPAFPGKATSYRVSSPALGMNLELSEHSAVQGYFSFAA